MPLGPTPRTTRFGIPQFGLATILYLVVAAALIASFVAKQDLDTFVAAWIGLTIIVIILAQRAGRHAGIWGGIGGASWPVVVLLYAGLAIIIERPIVQGQLYDEDGPVAFFAALLVAIIFSSAIGIGVGGSIGWVVRVCFELRE